MQQFSFADHMSGKTILCRARPAPPQEGTSRLVQVIPSKTIFGRVCGIKNSKEEINGAAVTCIETELKPIQIVTRQLAKLGATNIIVTRDPGVKVNAHMSVKDTHN